MSKHGNMSSHFKKYQDRGQLSDENEQNECTHITTELALVSLLT